MITTSVQSTAETKIDLTFAGQSKKTEITTSFSDCLMSLETSQSAASQNGDVSKDKKEKESAQTNALPVVTVPIMIMPETPELQSSAPPGELSENSVNLINIGGSNQENYNMVQTAAQETVTPSSMSEALKKEIRNMTATNGQETLNSLNSAETLKNEAKETAISGKETVKTSEYIKETAENYKTNVENNSEKTQTISDQVKAEIKIDKPTSIGNKAETLNTASGKSGESASDFVPLGETPDSPINNKIKKEQTTKFEIQNKSKEESETSQKPQQEKSAESVTEYRTVSKNEVTANSETNPAAAGTQPITDDKKSASKLNALPSEEKTASIKLGDKNTAVEEKVLPAQEKETGLKKTSGTEKNENTEFRLTDLDAVKETDNSASVKGESVLTQITRAVMEKKGRDNTRFTVELFPKDLGKVSVDMKLSNGKINLLLSAENKETVKALSEQLGHLKTALDANKVEVQNLDVSSKSQLNSAFTDANGSGEKFRGEDRGTSYKRDSANYFETDDKSESAKPRTYRQNHLLNYLA